MRLHIRAAVAFCALFGALAMAGDAKACGFGRQMARWVRDGRDSCRQVYYVQDTSDGKDAATENNRAATAEKLGAPKAGGSQGAGAQSPSGPLDMEARLKAWKDANQKTGSDDTQRVKIVVNGQTVELEIRVVSSKPIDDGPKPPPVVVDSDLAKQLKAALDKDNPSPGVRSAGLDELTGTYHVIGLILQDPKASFTPKQLSDVIAAHLRHQEDALKLNATRKAIEDWLNAGALKGVDSSAKLSAGNKDKLVKALAELEKTLPTLK